MIPAGKRWGMVGVPSKVSIVRARFELDGPRRPALMFADGPIVTVDP